MTQVQVLKGLLKMIRESLNQEKPVLQVPWKNQGNISKRK
jgi:hypothetical protein